MSTAVTTKEQLIKIVGEAVAEANAPMAEIFKALATPASKAGLTPAQFLAKSVGGNNMGFNISGHGEDAHVGSLYMLPSRDELLRGRKMGTVKNKKTGEPMNFGEMLVHLDNWTNRNTAGAVKQKSAERLDAMGVHVASGWDSTLKKTALAESSGVAGGYTVPPEFVEEIMMLPMEETLLAAKGHKVEMASATMTYPYLDVTTAYSSGVSPFTAGMSFSWLAEAATIGETEPQFRQMELRANQLCAVSIVSNTLLQDSAIALDALLTKLFGMGMGWAEDYAYFQGNGVGKPLGVLNSPATILVTRAVPGHITFADIKNMLSKIYVTIGRDKLFWATTQTCIPDILGLKDDAGRVLFIPLDKGVQEKIPGTGVQAFGSLFGIPLYITDKLPALGTQGDLMLIDPTRYLIGNRLELEIDVSREVKFQNYQMMWRVVARKDGQPWMSSYVTLPDGSTQVSVFTALK